MPARSSPFEPHPLRARDVCEAPGAGFMHGRLAKQLLSIDYFSI